MEKRILSLLLLVVLLVTSIPVLAVSATDGEAENTTEYYKWYVGADYGPTPTDVNVTLVGNFTAFANEDNSADGVYSTSGKKWYNKVTAGASNNITLYGTWSASSYDTASGGGISAHLSEGLRSSGALGQKFRDAGSTNTSSRPGDSSVRMHVPASWVNSNANVFVETSAVLTGVDGDFTGALWTTESATETFRFGALRGLMFGGIKTTSGLSLGMLWRAQASAYNDATGFTLNFREACGVTTHANGVEHKANFAPGGLTMFIKKSTGDEGITYSIGYNTPLVKNPNADVSDTGVSYAASTGEALNDTEHADLLTAAKPQNSDGSKFTMFNRAPMDVYTIRVYTGGFLTEAEREYNHLIDLLGFYQVPIPEGAKAGMLMNIASQFTNTIFVYDNDPALGAADYDEVKASLESALGYGPTEYYKWYVGAEYGPTPTDVNVTLAGNFTAFANEDNSEGAVYNPTGKGGTPWYNKVAGGDQLYLYSTKQWGPATDEKANGGGLNAGAATRANVTDSGDKGIRMEGGKTWLNSANVLVETSFVYVGTTGDAWGVADEASTTSTYENFRFGSLRGHLFPRFTGSTSYRLIEVWRAQKSAQTDYYGQNTNIRDICGGVENFTPAGLTLYMQKTTETDEGTDYITYSVRYNNGLTKVGSDISDTGVSYAGGADRISVADDATLWTTINSISSRDFKCTFYVKTQCDVYTLRAYTGGVLTEEEKAYNHFIDLLGFYQVEIPFGLTPDSLMPLASAYMDTAFTYGDTFDTLQAGLTAALDNVATVVCGSETWYYCVPAGGLDLAEIFDDMTVFGYRLGETNYAPTVALNAAETVTLLAVDGVQISNTVDVAVLGFDENEMLVQDTVFVRFNALVNKEQFLALDAVDGFAVLEMGILITPLSYIEQAAEYHGTTAAEAFNKMSLQTWYDVKGTVKDRVHTGAYLDVAAEEFRAGFDDADTEFTLSAGFGNFSEATLDHNPAFAAVAYFEVDLDGDGEAEQVSYGVFEEEKCVQIYEIAQSAMQLTEVERVREALGELCNEFYLRQQAAQE